MSPTFCCLYTYSPLVAVLQGTPKISVSLVPAAVGRPGSAIPDHDELELLVTIFNAKFVLLTNYSGSLNRTSLLRNHHVPL